VENHITLLAHSLGLAVAGNVYREIAHGDARRLEQLRCEAGARGIDRDRLDRALGAEFPRAGAAR
jgi:hypothetical protein